MHTYLVLFTTNFLDLHHAGFLLFYLVTHLCQAGLFVIILLVSHIG